jgi:glycosyltransferase involved in cell wall biosynthesis
VDFLAVILEGRIEPPPPPADLPLSRLVVIRAGGQAKKQTRRFWHWVTGRLPRSLIWRDWTAARELMASWSDRPYDLVWFSHAPAYFALADLVAPPHIVDLDNLESSLLRHRRWSLVRSGMRGPARSAVAAIRAAADAVDERRWRKLEQEIADAGASIVVCSGLDRARLGRENVWVVPNGYERAHSLEPTEMGPARSAGPVLIMVGLLTYSPNQDAAAFFTAQILPHVRRQYRNARFKLVGLYESDAAVAPLRRLPGVEVLGEVAEVAAELAAADIAVVPIRFGGGTRIKILEAFAYRIPVVSTTVGCEGLDVVDGEHLLIADDPAAFAAACVRLHEDADLRARLVTAAAQLWETRYRWTVLTPTIGDAVRAALIGDRRGQDHPAVQADQDGPRPGSANQ